MVLLAVCIVALAATAHAGWNICAKRVADGGADFVWLYQLVGYVAITPVGLALLLSGDAPPVQWLLAAGIGALLQLAYYVLLQFGYARTDVSILYPLASGLTPTVTVLLAVLLGERPSALVLAGVAVVVVGVVIITGRAPQPAGTESRRSDTGAKASGLVFGVLIAVVSACATLWDKQVISGYEINPLLFLWGVATGELLILTPYALCRAHRARWLWARYRREVLIVGALVPTAYILVLLALRHAPVTVIAPAKELSIVMAVLGAWLLLGESELKRRLLGAFTVSTGVFIIAMS